MRWPILRNAFAALVIVSGVAMAGFGRKRDPEPVPEPEPAEPEIVIPQAPPLWEDGPPVPVEATPEGLANISAQGCNACHGEAHDEWEDSAHHRSWRSPAFREATRRVGGSTVCKGCHLPLVNQHFEMAAGYIDGDIARPDLQPNDLWDATLMSEGVGCAACHVRDGAVVGTRYSPDAPHPITVSTELASSEACATCHQLSWPGVNQPLYDTYGEWKASPYAQAGVRCQDCHMPPRAGMAVATRFAATPSHAFESDTARALSILVDLDSAEVQRGAPFPVRLRLQNTGAGHSVPTGSPFKSYRVTVRLAGTDGRSLAEAFTHDLGRVIEEQQPWDTVEDNRIPAGGEVALDASFEVSQRKGAQPAVLEVTIRKVVGDEVSEPLATQRVPVDVL